MEALREFFDICLTEEERGGLGGGMWSWGWGWGLWEE